MKLFGSSSGGRHSGNGKKSSAADNAPAVREIPKYDTAPKQPASAQKVNKPAEPVKKTAPAAGKQSATAAKTPAPSGNAEEIVKQRNKAKKKKKALKTVLIILIVLAVLAAAAYVAIAYFTEAPDTNKDGILGKNDAGEELKAGVTNGRHDYVYTCLIVGVDQVSNSTDTIMVACFNIPEGTVNVINIPRDTLVNTAYNVKKINYIYPACINNNKDGIKALESEIQNMLGFGVDNYIFVNIQAAEQIVDTIGGVEFDMPYAMHYSAPDQDLYIDIDAGPQTLDGKNFVHALRFRDTYAGGDIQRIEFQQTLLKAMAKQLLTLGNVPNIGQVVDIIENNMETDLSADNIRFYIKEFLQINFDNIHFMTMPGNTNGGLFGLSYVFPDIDAWIDMVNEYVNPWVDDVGVENVVMVTYKNGNFYSTTGELKGGVGSFMGSDSGGAGSGASVYQFVAAKPSPSAAPTNTAKIGD